MKKIIVNANPQKALPPIKLTPFQTSLKGGRVALKASPNQKKKSNPGILSNWESTKKALNDADIEYKGDYLDPKDIGPTIGQAKTNVQKMQTGMKHIKHIANHNNSKN